jgi:hypothetical protein
LWQFALIYYPFFFVVLPLPVPAHWIPYRNLKWKKKKKLGSWNVNFEPGMECWEPEMKPKKMNSRNGTKINYNGIRLSLISVWIRIQIRIRFMCKQVIDNPFPDESIPWILPWQRHNKTLEVVT